MKHDISLYMLTDKDKQDLVNSLTKDISWVDDELIDSDYNTNEEDQDETDLF